MRGRSEITMGSEEVRRRWSHLKSIGLEGGPWEGQKNDGARGQANTWKDNRSNSDVEIAFHVYAVPGTKLCSS